MNRAGGLLRSIEFLYEAVLTPETWPAALEAAVEHFNCGHMVVMAQTCDGAGAPFLRSFGVDEKAVLRSASAYVEDTPINLARLPQGIVFDRATFWPDRDFERSEYYNEYIRPMNGFHALAVLHARPGARIHVALCRPKRAGEFDAATVAGLGKLSKHVATAIEFQYRLGSAQRHCAALERVFDHVASAVILTDAAGHPVFANARATQVIEQADGLSLGITGLVASNPKATRRLRETIAAVAAEDGAADAPLLFANGHRPVGEAMPLSIERPSQRPALRLALLPVWRLDPAMAGAARPRVAIFMTEPDVRPAVDEGALADTFGLRPREAAVVALLAAGLGPAEIAATLDIGLGTVRNYLKSAFQKTDTHSQAALVALARGFAVPMAR